MVNVSFVWNQLQEHFIRNDCVCMRLSNVEFRVVVHGYECELPPVGQRGSGSLTSGMFGNFTFNSIRDIRRSTTDDYFIMTVIVNPDPEQDALNGFDDE